MYICALACPLPLGTLQKTRSSTMGFIRNLGNVQQICISLSHLRKSLHDTTIKAQITCGWLITVELLQYYLGMETFQGKLFRQIHGKSLHVKAFKSSKKGTEFDTDGIADESLIWCQWLSKSSYLIKAPLRALVPCRFEIRCGLGR